MQVFGRYLNTTSKSCSRTLQPARLLVPRRSTYSRLFHSASASLTSSSYSKPFLSQSVRPTALLPQPIWKNRNKELQISCYSTGLPSDPSQWERIITEVVQELLKDSRVAPSVVDNAIQWASRNGHLDVVRELLKDKRVDPSAKNNSAIREASKNGHLKVVRELLKDKRVDAAI